LCPFASFADTKNSRPFVLFADSKNSHPFVKFADPKSFGLTFLQLWFMFALLF